MQALTVSCRLSVLLLALAPLGAAFSERPAAAAPAIANGGFEQGVIPVNPGYGPITSWTAAAGRGAGVARAGGHICDNGVPADGQHVGFIEEFGALSQTVSGFEKDKNYVLKLWANTSWDGNGRSALGVMVNGTTLTAQKLEPAGLDNPFHLYRLSFPSPGEGSYPVVISNLSRERRQALLIDSVEILEENGPAKIRMVPSQVVIGDGTIGVDSRKRVRAFNEGGAAAELKSARIAGAAASEFSLSQTVFPVKLEPGKAADMDITFHRKEEGESAGAELVVEADIPSDLRVLLTATAHARPTVFNGSFELGSDPQLPGIGDIPGWVCRGGPVGLNSTGMRPYHDNGKIPEGRRVAFVQNHGWMSQRVGGFRAGRYYLVSAKVNGRTAGLGLPHLQLQIDGRALPGHDPAPEIPPVQSRGSYTVPFRQIAGVYTCTVSGSHQLQLVQHAGNRGDRTVLLDDVRIEEIGPALSAAPWELVVRGPGAAAQAGSAVPPAPAAAQGELIWSDDIRAARATARRTGRKLVIYFQGAGSHGWPTVLRDPQVVQALRNYELVRLDFEQHVQIARTLGVFRGGTVNIYAADGTPIESLTAPPRADEFAARLRR